MRQTQKKKTLCELDKHHEQKIRTIEPRFSRKHLCERKAPALHSGLDSPISSEKERTTLMLQNFIAAKIRSF